MSFLDKIFKNNQIQEDNKKLKQTNIDFDYRLNSIYERLTKYGKYCDVYDGVSDEKIEKFSNEVYKKLNVIVPKEYKAFFKKTNGIYFGNGINILNIDEIIDKTIRFKDMMEDWEIGKIPEEFILISKYNDGDGYVFWYSKLQKYVIVDFLSDCELDDMESLKTVDNIYDVIEYLEKDFKRIFKL